MPELQVIARHTVREGEEDVVLAALDRLIAAARTEPGTLAFDAFHSREQPGRYVLLERYVSREAFEAHRATPHFTEIMLGEIAPRLAARTVEAYDVPDGGAQYR
jgi:quinol monooxygenase YgiN